MVEAPHIDLTEEVAATIMVRGICLIAKVSAEAAADDPDNSEADCAYQNARNEANLVAAGLSDPFYRDLAFHFVYVLCKRANDDAAAQRIFDRITTNDIRGKILDGRPALFD